MIKDILAAIGGMTLVFALLGAIGVGHFRFYYSDKFPACEGAKP